jgi:hypothetical protein
MNPKYVYTRDGKMKGTITSNNLRMCAVCGTRNRPRVLWPDKSVTYPCPSGMKSFRGQWKIM